MVTPADNLPLLHESFDCFRLLAFDDQAPLAQFLFKAYLHCDRIENQPETALLNSDAQMLATLLSSQSDELSKIGTVCESVLSFSISFMFALLEDPNVWKSDCLPFEEEQEETK